LQTYGIVEQARGENLFFYFSNVSSDFEEHGPICVGDMLEFRVGPDQKGRRCAQDIKRVEKSGVAVLPSARTSQVYEEDFTEARSTVPDIHRRGAGWSYRSRLSREKEVGGTKNSEFEPGPKMNTTPIRPPGRRLFPLNVTATTERLAGDRDTPLP
jgi:hypothetical protein